MVWGEYTPSVNIGCRSERFEYFLKEPQGFKEKGWFPSELIVVNGMKVAQK